MHVQNPILKTVCHQQTAGKRKRRKRNGFKFTRHGLLVDHSSFTLDHKPGLRSNQISAKAFPWACITPEGKVSKPSPLNSFPLPFYLSGWPPCALAPGLSVTETALCSGGGEIKPRSRRQQQTAGDHRGKIKDPSHIFSLHVHWISIVIRGIKCF